MTILHDCPFLDTSLKAAQNFFIMKTLPNHLGKTLFPIAILPDFMFKFVFQECNIIFVKAVLDFVIFWQILILVIH